MHERSGGHPFYARELCHLLASHRRRHRRARRRPRGHRPPAGPPVRRLRRAAGRRRRRRHQLQPDVLADVTGDDPTQVMALAAEADAAGILARADAEAARPGSPTTCTGRPSTPRCRRRGALDLHHRVAAALLRRHERGSPVFAAELARHFTAAMPAAGTAPAMAWAHAAARADAGRFAFAEAAGHLARLRSAIDAAGHQLPDADLVGLLTTEADLRLRAGDAAEARALLDTAWARATATGEAELLGAVALGLDRIDARFAMPRADLIAVLDTARQALQGSGTPAEAQVTAALARQLQHSVPADRPRARPLAEQAVTIARTLDDPATLASCLLAQHDTLWTPGTAADRAAIPAEIADLAKRANDAERHAQALLLTATGQLESGSAAFRATLAEYAYLTERLRQPRHDYLLRTRQAALALLDGDIDTGERLSAEAAVLGEAVGDSDTGNVRMSQRLEIVRARNDPAELRDMAAEAVRWWIGAPAHAHAVAAGFSARAGDLDIARRELDTVLALRLAHRPLVPVVDLHRRDDDRRHRARRPAAVPAAARRSAADRRHLRGQRRPRLLHGRPRPPRRAALRRARPARTGPAVAPPGPGHPPSARRPGLAGRDPPCAGRPRRPGRAEHAPAGRTAATTGRRRSAGDSPATTAARLRRVGDMWQASFRGTPSTCATPRDCTTWPPCSPSRASTCPP